jgi:hypothetical protein
MELIESLGIATALDLTNSYLIRWCTEHKLCKLELKLTFRLKIKYVQAVCAGLHTGSKTCSHPTMTVRDHDGKEPHLLLSSPNWDVRTDSRSICLYWWSKSRYLQHRHSSGSQKLSGSGSGEKSCNDRVRKHHGFIQTADTNWPIMATECTCYQQDKRCTMTQHYATFIFFIHGSVHRSMNQ